MSDLAQRVARLSPEKRALLTQKLRQKRVAAAQEQAIARRKDLGSFPMSFAQQRLWFLDQLEPESAFYNIPAGVHLVGPLDVPALKQGLNTVVGRHEVLRATFVTRNGEPLQVVPPEMRLTLPEIDLTGLPESERERQAWQLAEAEAQRPFDLTSGPLIRATLVRLHPTERLLLLTMHHIVADGWSIGVFVREVATIYDARVDGRPSPLPELPIQYADFAHWQREWLHGEVQEKQLAYWREQLAGAPPLLKLPTDRPRPAIQTYNGDHRFFDLSPDLSAALEALSRREDATLFMTLLAAFQTLLYRYTGQGDVCVGTPIANRNRAEIEGLIGFFINTLVLRANLADDPTFRQLLQRVRQATLDAYAHQDLPFERLVDVLQPERDMSHAPLFQVMFVMQNAPAQTLELSGLSLSLAEIETGAVKFDLVLTLEKRGAGLTGTVGYNTDLFDAATIERLIEHLQILLAGVAADPARRVSELPLLTATERRQLLEEWCASSVDYFEERCVHRSFEAQVERAPEAVAATLGDEALTYRELNRRANQVAHHLRRLGVGPETLVGLCIERSPVMLVGLLGILKAGGAYVPLDPYYPAQRLAFMLDDTQSPVLLTQAHLVERLPIPSPQSPTPNIQILRLDADWPIIAQERDTNPANGALPDNLAYVIYTSGSTGLPKGVLLQHRGLSNLVFAQIEAFAINTVSRLLQFASLSFDASVSEIFTALMSGATLCMARRERLASPPDLLALLLEQEISTATLPPSLLRLLSTTDLPALRTLVSAGERCTWDIATGWSSGRRFLNAYGPTEATVGPACYPLDGVAEGTVVDLPAATVPIGRPIPNVRLYVLDRRLQPVPVGVGGELCIGGSGLARGYLNRPDLTAEKFVPAPSFTSSPGEEQARLYRTGDLVRYLPDGNLEFLGRIDQQVKVRGFRVELREIELVLAQHQAIQEVVVLVREEKPGGRRLVAYVVPAAGQRLPPAVTEELRRFLQEKLPDYMVPSTFVTLEALPLTPSGKLDRRALAALDGAHPEVRTRYAPPRNDLERALVEMWREILGSDGIGIHDNFFERGGDSIRGAIFINQLEKVLGQPVYVVALFEAPTIAGLAGYLAGHYPEAIKRRWGDLALPGETSGDGTKAAVHTGRVNADQVARFRRLIEPLPPAPLDEDGARVKNPAAVFVFSPPRSGSTLLRAMLGGHPQLFAPPELELLSFNTLQERKQALSGRYSFWLEGTLRAIMEIRGCDADEAQQIMEDCERRQLSSKAFYRLLQDWIGERVLVDKTPAYALDVEVLKRAETDFEQTRYIHLLRHPHGMIRSFVKAKLDQVFFRPAHSFARRELAELIWLICQQNIVAFMETIPAERKYSVAFEDLVREPRAAMEGLCEFLGIGYHPDMVKPYQGRRMTDGIHPLSKMLGDVKFHQHKDIDPNVAQAWKQQLREDFLGELTWQMAEALGYERWTPVHPPKIERVPRDGDLPLSFAQQRLWVLDQLEPGSAFYNIPTAVRLTGALDVAALAQSLNEIVRRHEVLHTTFPAQEGKATLVITPPMALALPVVDLSALSELQQEAETRRLIAQEAQRPFDLARGPLVRAGLLRLEAETHLALLTMHHIVSDGWSVGVFIREVAALYQAFSTAKPSRRAGRRQSPLPELPIQYVDYAHWQRGWLRGEVLERQIAYWKQQLKDCPPVIELPTDRPRPAIQTFAGARQLFTLPRSLTQALKALGQQQEATLFMTLLAALDTLLYRYSGQADVCVGTPMANRNRAEIEGLIGFFVNTLVLRADLSGDPSFRELLRRVRQAAVGAYAHQDVPFEMLVDALQPERNLSHTPLFQVMFALQNTLIESLELPGLTLSPLDADSGTAKFDLTLFMVEREGTLHGSIEYNTDLFDDVTIERMLGHLRQLLEGIVADPERPISQLSLLAEDERRVMLGEWNDTRNDDPLDQCIHQLTEAQAARTPDAVALVFEHQRLTYRQLDVRANQLAHYLKRLGVGPEVLVGVCTERSPEMVIGQLGILKAGGTYVPIDPSYPQERVSFMLKDARVSVLLTLGRLRGTLPKHTAQVVCLDDDWDAIAQEDHARLDSGATAQNLAYVLFTSGSTGLPKGVAVEHRNAVALIQWARHVFSALDLAGVLAATLNSWDLSVFELFVTLSWGGTVILAENALQLPDLPAADQVTLINTVPSAITELLRSDGIPRSVRTVNLAGEPLLASVVDQLYERPWIRRVHDLYGPTEDTTYSTFTLRRAAGPELIGRPINNTQVYLLDPNQQPVPVGVPGELYIGGAGVVRGYLNRPELTAERFVPDPFALPAPGVSLPQKGIEGGARLYRTGDLARYRADGNLEYLGRIDHQVKIRGFRIELGEIETVLREHPALKETLILAREDAPGDKRLVAYVVSQQAPAPSVSELRSHLKAKLPEYMLPSAFVTLEAMPLTPNGKVDRRALPAPDENRPDLEVVYVAPRTRKEQALAGIWSRVLGVEQIGVHDNFFELGGDSILSIQVISRANQAGLQLTPRQLFQHPTVAGLAAVAGTARAVQAEQDVVKGPLPLTPIQRWFFERALPEPHHWNQALLLEVGQALEPGALRGAVSCLLEHHDALRLRFERVKGSASQRGASSWQQVNAGLDKEIPFQWVDLSELPQREHKAAVESRAAELQASLDLAEGPLMRVAYFDLGAGRADRLLIVIHHLAVDGVSWRVLMEDFQTAYQQLGQGAAAQLPPKTTSFQHWTRRLVEYAQSESVRAELPYWLALAEQGVAPLPVDYPGGANTEASARSVQGALSVEETQALLQEVPAAYGTEINDALLMALAQVMAGWTGSPALLVELEGHGREDILDDVDLSRTVGWFTTAFPVRLNLEGAQGPGERLTAVKEQLRRLPNRGIGYGLLRYLSQDERVSAQLETLPAPQVSFNYLGQVVGDPSSSEAALFGLAGESSGPERSPRGHRSRMLDVSGSVVKGRLQLRWSYSENLHRRATIGGLAEDLVEALRVLIAHCRSPEAGGYTPSDFADVELDQDEIEALMAEIGEAM